MEASRAVKSRAITAEQQRIQELEARVNRLERESSGKGYGGYQITQSMSRRGNCWDWSEYLEV